MKSEVLSILLMGSVSAGFCSEPQKPNIIFIMADDYTSQAVSAYGGRLNSVFQTPNIDRIVNEGVRFDNCFVTNSICTPSRACILTGEYSHKNGVYTLDDKLDTKHMNVAKELQNNGYTTSVIGKWHLHSEPTGFDYYNVLPGQGKYRDPFLKEKGKIIGDFEDSNGKEKHKGYSTDVITDETLEWLDGRDQSKPFFLMCHFKAPHRPWTPAKRFKHMFDGVTIPEPDNLFDDYENRGEWAKHTFNKIGKDMKTGDLGTFRRKDTLQGKARLKWAYQLYMKRYLACCAAVDENVGRLLDYLENNGLDENTIVVFTGDQGFFLGEHGFFDKRMMLEECFSTPLLIKYPKQVKAGQVKEELVSNIDFAPTFLDYANVQIPEQMQGKSMKGILSGETQKKWRKSIYYRYWMHGADHGIPAHYGIRTERYKLIFYYGLQLGMKGTDDYWDPYNKAAGKITATQPEWELYDLEKDPAEMNSVYNDASYRKVVKKLKKELLKQKKLVGDSDEAYPELQEVTKKYWN